MQKDLITLKDTDPLGTITEIVLRVGFLSKNVQMGKQVFLQ